MVKTALLSILLFHFSLAKIFYQESFDSDWEDRWVTSDWKRAEQGKFEWSRGDWYGNLGDQEYGIKTSQDAHFYAMSSKFEPFDIIDTDMVLQFSVKHTQRIDCGGAYIKLLPANTDQKSFGGDSDYFIMFGPDICGSSTKKVHVIFNYNGENNLINHDIKCETDQLTHVYTLVLSKDGKYNVFIDGNEKQSGSLLEDWDMLPPRMIPDPAISKPVDWVDEAMINDPDAIKPADWDSIPKEIIDPEAVQPEDWDEEEDGTWDPPMILNPEYKGEWMAPLIKNPAYKGEWEHPMIPNPAFSEDDVEKLGKYTNVGVAGFELWQVKAGTIFDNIIITDNLKEAKDFMDVTWGKSKDDEKHMHDIYEDERKKKEEEERKRIQAEKDASATDDDDEDEEEIHIDL